MTEQRKAVEEWYRSQTYFSPVTYNAWQASKACEQARITKLLDSPEFLEFMVKKLIYKTSAQDLIEAIKQRINQGE